ncbi:hypothetical protein SAMN05660816_00008 [Niastella yeongjuensis]|nr:hypothetical protein SAMN05660816_00008 [Niastella yeongjuensis]
MIYAQSSVIASHYKTLCSHTYHTVSLRIIPYQFYTIVTINFPYFLSSNQHNNKKKAIKGRKRQ